MAGGKACHLRPCAAGGQRQYDWVVIGGGITGLCAARLAELAPDAAIALLEADRIGRSTAGRNSGFFVDLPHDISSESYSRSVEADQADVRFQRHGIDYVRTLVQQHGIACDWRDDGKFHAAVSRKGEPHSSILPTGWSASAKVSNGWTRLPSVR
jgi:glycine/D-amino acid oxidase-like deaminating enzyme